MHCCFLALVRAYGKTNFVSINNETITQICETDIKINLSIITKGTTFILSSRAVEVAVTLYALSQQETRHNYNQGCILSESIN